MGHRSHDNIGKPMAQNVPFICGLSSTFRKEVQPSSGYQLTTGGTEPHAHK